MTIKSVEDRRQPNLVLTKNKKARVKGKLYWSRKEYSNQTLREKSKTAKGTRSLNMSNINEQFKLDYSITEEVSWFTSKVFTQQEYE